MEGEKERIKVASDKYRKFLHEEQGAAAVAGSIQWRHGGPPIYDAVNNLLNKEEPRDRDKIYMYLTPALDSTMVWAEGSLEETVQNAIKSWEMVLSHKTRVKDFRTINPKKFKLFVNGREGLSAEETLKVGSYNALLKSSVPEEFKYYKADEESFEYSFPRGFAWEVINVYTGPPLVTFKFRHWGFFEGPFKGHTPTRDMVQFYGIGIMKVDESVRAEDVEVYHDPAELFAGLLKGPPISESNIQRQEHRNDNTTTQQCPYQN